MESLVIPALGRAAFFGQLYDARRDCLSSGASLFLQNTLPPSCITCIDTPSTYVNFVVDESYSTAFTLQDIRGELKLSVLSGLVGLEGSGSYLKDVKQSSRSVRCTLVHRITTQSESINISHADFPPLISKATLSVTNATHFVSGIEWGANAFASLEDRNTDNTNKRHIEAKLTAKWKEIVDAGGSYKDQDTKEEGEKNYTLKLYGDVLPDFDGPRPKTAEDAWQLFCKIKECMTSYNGGKGKQLKFKLYPLSQVAVMLDMELKVVTIVSSLRINLIEGLERLFDELLAAKQAFNDFWDDVLAAPKGLVHGDKFEYIQQFKAKVEAKESELRGAVQKGLVSIRSSSSSTSDEYTSITKFQELSPAAEVQGFLKKEDEQLQIQLTWVRELQNRGIRFAMGLIQGKSFLDSIPLQLGESSVFVLLYSDESRQTNAESWESNWRLFCNLAHEENSQSGKSVLYVLLVKPEELLETPELPSYLRSNTRVPRIIHFLKGRPVSGDLLADHRKLSQLNLVKGSDEPDVFTRVPNRRKPLCIRCPGSITGSCPNCLRDWKCERCTKTVEFGCDGYFYCECGRVPDVSCSFRCCAEAHGLPFLQFKDDNILRGLLEEMEDPLPSVREINILLLGETGAGKSSFVNAFAQYIIHAEFESAESAKELDVLIPISLCISSDTQYRIGESDPNEVNEAGQSATQHCRSYVFHIGDGAIIRLIDTPGVGDTRGFEIDRANVEAMVSFLNYYDDIHGICVILKPNNSRITATFAFCLQELLCHLHKNARDNVVFLYTHGHSTRFKPGSTSIVIRKMLKDADIDIALNERTQYVVDNEPVLLLMAARRGHQLSAEEREDCSRDWRRSVGECDRLMKCIISLKPQRSREMLRLNAARGLVEECSEALGKLLVTLQKNKKEVAECERKERELKERAVVTEYETKVVPARDGPQLVCKNCEGRVGVCEYNMGWFAWIGILSADARIAESQAKSFQKMEGLQCSKCGCRVTSCHERREYQVETVKKERRDEAVNAQLHEAQAEGSYVQKRTRDLQEDQDTITQVSTKFASFLKQNALTPYNDQVEYYLQQQIAKEDDASVKMGLEHMLDSYRRQIEIINNSTSKSPPSIISVDDIHRLVEKLSSLKSDPQFGRILKNKLETFGHGGPSSNPFMENILQEKHVQVEESIMEALTSK